VYERDKFQSFVLVESIEYLKKSLSCSQINNHFFFKLNFNFNWNNQEIHRYGWRILVIITK
jgi:hypothetical protein